MCGPIASAIATFAVSALSSVAEFAAAAQEKRATEDAAQAAYEQDLKTLSQRQIQEQDAASQQKQEQNLSQAENQSEVQAQAAGAGVGGVSVDNLVQDIGRRAARNREIIGLNTRNITEQLQLEKAGSKAQNQGRINTAPQPNPLALIAGIGGAALSGLNTYNKQKYRMA